MKSKFLDPGLALSGMDAAVVPLCSCITFPNERNVSRGNQHRAKVHCDTHCAASALRPPPASQTWGEIMLPPALQTNAVSSQPKLSACVSPSC